MRNRLHIRVWGHRDSLPVEKCPLPHFGLKEFIKERVIDNPELYLSLNFQAYRGAEKWEPVNIVRRPIHGVNNPLKGRTLSFESALLCQEIMIREGVKKDLTDRFLSEFIHLTDGVDFPLVLHLITLAEMSLQNSPCLFSCRNRYL
jgi:hypothetical protein